MPRYAREYGGVTLIWILGRPALVLNDPELIGEVLDTRAGDFYKKSPCDALRPVVADDPFITNGADWAFKRANHPFSLDQLDPWLTSQVPPLRQSIGTSLTRLIRQSEQSPVDLTQSLLRLSFDAFAVAVWGRLLEDRAYDWFLQMGRTGDRRMKLDLMLPCLPPVGPGFRSASRSWFGLFDQLIAQATGDPARPAAGDLLSVWLRHGTKLPAASFRNAMANIFFGGVFSVASVLATSLYLLAQNPAASARLQSEMDDLARRSTEADREALEACGYLDAVLRESMRSYPPVPLYFRNSAARSQGRPGRS